MSTKWDGDDLGMGRGLAEKTQKPFLSESQTLRYEIFCDWLPTDDCFVSLDNSVKDKWGSPVAKVRIGYHPHEF